MPSLSEYVDPEALKELTSLFSAAAGEAVRMLAPDGQVLAGPPGSGTGQAEARILVGGQHVGTVALAGQAGQPPGPQALRMLDLMQDVLLRLVEQGAQLRDRIEELAAMYRLAEVFTGKTDPKEVHKLVAETMAKVTGADACSIRVLNEDGTELATMAAYGLSDAYMSKGRILLRDSQIDQEIFSKGQIVYIADERTDSRVLYKTEAQREGLVSALCVPMAYRGRVEGVIRVYTRRPHVFDWFETSLIRGVASQAASAVVNTRLYHEALEAEAMRRQMRLAGEVQRRMVPAKPPRVPGLDIAAVFVPTFEVGGDFYDFIELPGGNLGVAVADVAGKGLQGSLLMASARSALRAHVAHIYELSLALASVNVHMWRDGGGGDFVTMIYGVLDMPNRRLTYCNAGHEPGLLLRAGQVRTLITGGGVLGINPSMRYEQEALELQSGDALALYTDGLVEAINFRDESFGRERTQAAALAAWQRGASAAGIAQHLLWEMRRFCGLQSTGDDLTLVVIRVQ